MADKNETTKLTLNNNEEPIIEKPVKEPLSSEDVSKTIIKPLVFSKKRTSKEPKHKITNKAESKNEQDKNKSSFEKDFWLFIRRNSYKLILALVIFVLCIVGILVAHSFALTKSASDNAAAISQTKSDVDKLTANTKATTANGAKTDEATQRSDGNNGANETTTEVACVHDWSISYKTVHHDAVTHTEYVQPVYEDQTTYHTVCNTCEEVIDGKAAEHIESTGHSGYSTNVPITSRVMVSEGYNKTVVDKEAYDETVADHLVCTKCGEEKPLDSAE